MLAFYCVASFIHFAHNAEFIASYPNLPPWLTRTKVYAAWLAITSVGLVAIAAYKLGLRVLGIVLIAIYAAFGFDGLAHYSRAPFLAHSLAMNATIGFEVVAAAVLLVASFCLLFRGRTMDT
ncbi:MAG: hypothetical protein ABI843_02630 [Dokdonella sp.]